MVQGQYVNISKRNELAYVQVLPLGSDKWVTAEGSTLDIVLARIINAVKGEKDE